MTGFHGRGNQPVALDTAVGGGGAYGVLAIQPLVIHSLQKRSAVLTPNRDTSDIWALSTFSQAVYTFGCAYLFYPLCVTRFCGHSLLHYMHPGGEGGGDF